MGVTINKQRSSGDWYIWITHKGKRTSRKVGKDRKYAMKIASEYQKKLLLGEIDFSNGKSPNSEGRLFGEFFHDYLDNAAKHRLKYNSWMSYQKVAELYLLPEWKNTRLEAITRQEVKRLLLEKQAAGLSVQNIRICISAIFAEAVEREILTVNPAHNLGKVFRKSVPEKSTQFLSKEQSAILLDLAPKEVPEYYDFLITAFRTGMRLGELLGLSWDCVNFETKQIAVKRSFSHDHWDTPKSHKVRHIDMSDGLYAALKKRCEMRGHELPCKSHKRNKILSFLIKMVSRSMITYSDAEYFISCSLQPSCLKSVYMTFGIPMRHCFYKRERQYTMSKNNWGIVQSQ